jgi:hypothetical protein
MRLAASASKIQCQGQHTLQPRFQPPSTDQYSSLTHTSRSALGDTHLPDPPKCYSYSNDKAMAPQSAIPARRSHLPVIGIHATGIKRRRRHRGKYGAALSDERRPTFTFRPYDFSRFPSELPPQGKTPPAPNRFAPSEVVIKTTPVKLPPGRLRLATSPSLTGSFPVANTTSVLVTGALAASAAGKVRDYHGWFPTKQITDERW